jgi:glycosyltransferase involved in cell wall biosynthesis
MKILIVNNMAPFIWGGAEELAVHLMKNLKMLGHEAEALRIPFQWEPATRIPSQMLMVRALELWNVDQVIALKFPAYLIRHPQKTLWVLHQYRQAYDLLDAGQSNLPPGELGRELQSLIKNADIECFSECKKIFTNSEVTKQRLLRYNEFDANVLMPPVNDPELFKSSVVGDYIFAGGRINNGKRQKILIEALAKTNERVRLLIAGPPDSVADADLLRETVEKFNVAQRVHLDLRFLPRDIYANYVNQSAAVAYLPFDEDSLGYVAMEAATAGKALITATDSGGILGLVKHKETGWVTAPDVDELAEAMEAVFESPRRTEEYGRAAQALWEKMGINWPETINNLLR